MAKHRFEALDAFRGVCAVSVMFFHMRWVDAITDMGFFRGAWVFVEFFFVLSGFVLAHGYGFKQTLHFRDFMTARFVRLYPLHFATFSAVFLFQFVNLAAIHFAGLSVGPEPFEGQFAVTQIPPNLLLLQSWTPYTYTLSFNEASWSISIEFYAYAILFLSVVLFRSFRVLAWLLISVLSFALIFMQSTLIVDTAVRGLSCFFGGAAAYALYRKVAHIKLSYTAGSLMELGLLASVYLFIQQDLNDPAVWSSMLFIVVVIAFAFEAGVVSRCLRITPFQLLGQWSYSIYLIHFPIILYLGAVFTGLDHAFGLNIRLGPEPLDYNTFGSAALNNLAVAVFVGVVLLCSKFTYEHIELRAMQAYKSRRAKSQALEAQ